MLGERRISVACPQSCTATAGEAKDSRKFQWLLLGGTYCAVGKSRAFDRLSFALVKGQFDCAGGEGQALKPPRGKVGEAT